MIKRILVLILLVLLPLLGWAAENPTELPYRGEGHIMLNAADLEWGAIASMAPGAKIAVIEGDLSKEEPFTFRLKLPADYTIAPHTHPAYERVTVLSGTFHFAHGEVFDRTATLALEPGGFVVMPPGAPMYAYTEEETIVQLHGTGPWGIVYLNPADDPRN
ncbi:cupin domain-containing protein [Geoalkalibacter halelectricus]|uniref:cupin domain-containing protein n=1 Tax=Geoalkalibacter halelectricus TaxID=2847045 RepID=UPI003D1944A1